LETNDSIGPLIQAFAEGELDKETQALVQRHLANNPDSCQEHFEIKKATRLLRRAMSREKLPEDFSRRVEDRIFSKDGHSWTTAREFALRRRIARTRQARRRLVFALAATACIAVMAVGVVYVYLQSIPSGEAQLTMAPDYPVIGSIAKVRGRTQIAMASTGKSLPFGYGVYTDTVLTTVEDSGMAIVLEDESIVRLNEKTTLTVKGPRWLKLFRGEILVNVEKKEGKAFQIDTPDAKVIVMGTTFLLLVDEEGTEIHLMEGNLLVRGKEGHLALDAGDSVEVRENGSPQFMDSHVFPVNLEWADSLATDPRRLTTILAHDDGNPSGAGYLPEDQEAWVTFEAKQPGELRSIWIYGNVYSFSPGISEFGKTFGIQVYDSDRNPTGVRHVKSYKRFESVPGWTSIDLVPPVRVEGRFHVSVRPNAGEDAALILATDEDAVGKHSQIATKEDDALDFISSDNWMVRAIVASENTQKN